MSFKFNTKILILFVILIGPVIPVLVFGHAKIDLLPGGISVTSLAEMYRSLGIWAVAISLTLNVLQTFIVFMPSVFLSGANAVVFGFFWGTVISWIGEVIGAAAAFVLYRYFGQATVLELEKSKAYLKKINELSTKRGFTIVLALRLLPAFPSGLVNLLGALSKISFATFILATGIGKLPSLVLETLIGHDIFLWQENWTRLVLVLGAVISGYLLYHWQKTRKKQ